MRFSECFITSDSIRTTWTVLGQLYKYFGQSADKYTNNSDSIRTIRTVLGQFGQYLDNSNSPRTHTSRIYKRITTVLMQPTFHLPTFSCGTLKNTVCTSESCAARSKLANSASPDLAHDWYAVRIESTLVEHSPFPILAYASTTPDI